MHACSVAWSCLTLCDPMDYSLHLCPWIFTGKNIGVGCHLLLGIFPTQGSIPSSFGSPALAGKFFITEPLGKKVDTNLGDTEHGHPAETQEPHHVDWTFLHLIKPSHGQSASSSSGHWPPLNSHGPSSVCV